MKTEASAKNGPEEISGMFPLNLAQNVTGARSRASCVLFVVPRLHTDAAVFERWGGVGVQKWTPKDTGPKTPSTKFVS